MPIEVTAPSPLSIKDVVDLPVLGQQELQRDTPDKLNPQQRVLQMLAEGMGMGTPAFVPRDQWQQRNAPSAEQPSTNPSNTSHYLEFGADGKQHLVLPSDLRPWEVVGVLKELDAILPEENRKERNVALEEVGTFLRNSGIYLATRIPTAFSTNYTSDYLARVRFLAEQMASEFFDYGTSLMTGEEPKEHTPLDAILQANKADPLLQYPHTEATIAEFLLGENLYEHRKKRVEKLVEQGLSLHEATYQVERQTLNQFFRTVARAEKLFQEKQEKQENGQEDKPSIEDVFLQKAHHALSENIQNLTSEASIQLTLSLLKEGMQYVKQYLNPTFSQRYLLEDTDSTSYQRYLDDPSATSSYHRYLEDIRADSANESPNMYDLLGIDGFKKRLDQVRQTNDREAITQLEQQIVDRIQTFTTNLRSHPYLGSYYLPVDIVSQQKTQCVGASLIATTLLSELQIPHAVVDIPEHSSFLVVLADGTVQMQDMLNGGKKQLTEEMLLPGSQTSITSIAEFARSSLKKGIITSTKRQITLNPQVYDEAFSHLKRETTPVSLYEPTTGIAIQLLENMSDMYSREGNFEEGIVAAEQALLLDPNAAFGHMNKAKNLFLLGRMDEALTSAERAIQIDPLIGFPYIIKGVVFEQLGHEREALEAFEQASTLSPNDRNLLKKRYDIYMRQGQYEKALEVTDQLLGTNEINADFLNQLKDGYKRKATVLENMGRTQDAIDAYREYLIFDHEDNDEVQRIEEKIRELQEGKNQGEVIQKQDIPSEN